MKVVSWFQSHPYHRLKLKQKLDTFHQSSLQETWYLVHFIRFTMPRIVCWVSPAFGDFSQFEGFTPIFFPRANIFHQQKYGREQVRLILQKLCCTNHSSGWISPYFYKVSLSGLNASYLFGISDHLFWIPIPRPKMGAPDLRNKPIGAGRWLRPGHLR